MEKILITGYDCPDLDGVACAFAYSQLLNTLGKNTTPIYFGTPHREANYVMNKYKINNFLQGEEINLKDKKLILVDASELHVLPKQINPLQIIEVIDHRAVNQKEAFTNAKIQIELVGSAATLIAEKFFENNITPSKTSAALLYLAIVSNTINFKANVTTPRDHKMATYLKTISEVKENDIIEMFKYKSTLGKDLAQELMNDVAIVPIAKKNFLVLQLEMVGLEELVKTREEELTRALTKLSKNADYAFLTGIDLEYGFNIFLTPFKTSQDFLKTTLNVDFSKNIAKREGILMRKELFVIFRKYFQEQLNEKL